jgi:hypothetical protein
LFIATRRVYEKQKIIWPKKEAQMRVCSTEYVYHALLNPEFDRMETILRDGLRPLSDFPESERWQQIEKQMPGFYQNLYTTIAQPVLQRAYSNSGIFVTPIDFQRIPTSFMKDKLRFKIPVTRLDPDYCVLTYVLHDERVALPLTPENMEKTANLW